MRIAAIAFCLAFAPAATGEGDSGNFVDRHIKAGWETRGLHPAKAAGDAEFLRRVTLDLTGTIPTIEETEKFLADRSASKREKKVDELLASHAFARYWSQLWTVTLVGWFQDASFDGYNREELREWLEDQIRRGVPWDRVALALLSAAGNPARNPAANFAIRYLVESPEALTTRVVRTFLGMRLQCAQCHDHPFDTWLREDFYGMASFFGRTQVYQAGNPEGAAYRVQDVASGDGLQPEGYEKPVPPRFLNGVEPATNLWRQDAAVYITRYPQFARAMVNRVWTHLMGRGIVHPPDNFGKRNKPSHAELLEDLAKEFVQHQFDLKHVIRTIATSRAYQLGSENTGIDGANEKWFVYAIPKPLTPYQLWNAIARATGLEKDYRGDETRIENDRLAYMSMFADGLDGDVTDANAYAETSQNILTKLSTDFLQGLGVSENNSLLTRLMAANPERRIEMLYLALLSRLPTEEERRICRKHVASVRSDDETKAVRDLFFALVHSHEFSFNH